jgi:tRNA G18 (ribose-2'-O)-methylase SpoU
VAELVRIDDVGDPRLADYVRLRDVQLRRHLEVERGLFIAEGEKVVRRAVEAGCRPRSFLMAKRWLTGLADVLASAVDVPCFVVTEAVAEEVTGFHVHRGALASMQRPVLPAVEAVLDGARRVVVPEDVVDHASVGALVDSGLRTSRLAVFEDFVDHANVGAGFRSAAALGVDGVLVTPRCADPLYRRSIKVSMGAVFQVPWTRIDPWPGGIGALRDQGYVTAALTLDDGSIPLHELAARDIDRLALIFGSEGRGVSPQAACKVDLKVRIPMAAGVDSLNVAAAAAVAFYATRIRKAARSMEAAEQRPLDW